jgi:preprotein translocase subunit SecE
MQMKLNWKTLKVMLAFVIVIGAILWAVDSTRTQSYSGTNLSFAVGNGPTTVKNASDQPVPVQLVDTGSRSFSVSSTIKEVPGSSTKQDIGSSSTQVVEFDLPPGVSEFTVTRSSSPTTQVNFVAPPDTRLEATTQPLNATNARTTLIVAVVVILGALFFSSSVYGHRWIGPVRRMADAKQAAKVLAENAAAHAQGHTIRAFGDNRSDISN